MCGLPAVRFDAGAAGAHDEANRVAGAGMIELTTTLLEMRERPKLQEKGPHRGGMLLRLEEPSVSFYRYLYETVGGSWIWWSRRRMGDAGIIEIIGDPRVDVFVLYLGGVPAGFFELDRRVEGEIELVHFGLVLEFAGRELHRWLLAFAVEMAWNHEPERLWTTTTNFSDPRSVLTYQWAGFVPYETRRESVEDPRLGA